MTAIREIWVNLTYPISAEEPAIAGIGWRITTTYVVSLESIDVNMGGPSDDAKEGGNKGLVTASENLRCVGRESAWP
jgi:hypothetical protein